MIPNKEIALCRVPTLPLHSVVACARISYECCAEQSFDGRKVTSYLHVGVLGSLKLVHHSLLRSTGQTMLFQKLHKPTGNRGWLFFEVFGNHLCL